MLNSVSDGGHFKYTPKTRSAGSQYKADGLGPPSNPSLYKHLNKRIEFYPPRLTK